MNLERISDTLHLPKDVVLGGSVLHMIGQYEIYIENYKSILEFNENTVKIRTRDSILTIQGKHLQIPYYSETDMKIRGRILEIKIGTGM